MMKSKWVKLATTGIMSACLATTAFGADEIEEVIVTGSFIKGTPIDSESPVTVLKREELAKQGAPSIVEMVRRLSASSGVDGESNQFQSNASEGVASVNIRGLGAARTLVLINGKRQTPISARLPGGRFVDVNGIPKLAVERVEVLKEGAAATYGSDAISGVVNFLTRKNFEGLEFSASHQEIDGSDGNQDFGAIFGKDFGNVHWVTSFGYETRNELSLREIENSQVSYAENNQGGFSSIGNPGVFFDPADAGSTFGALPLLSPNGTKDPNCAALGGVDQSIFCRFRYTDFDNAIEEEERYQLFSEINGELSNGMNFHAEFLYSKVDVPEWKTSPSYPPQALFGDIQTVQNDHPGLLDMAAQFPQFDKYITPTITRADDPLTAADESVTTSGTGATFYGRIAGVGASVGREAKREYDTYRVAATLDGEFENGIGWDVGVSWSRNEGELEGVDAQIGRTKLAFNGFGGENCAADLSTSGVLQANGATAGAGDCLYYNPFSNAIPVSNAESTFGVANPSYNAAVANSAEVLAYLDDTSLTKTQSELLVLDAVFQGEFAGGEAAWAAGYQYRDLEIKSELDDLINLNINPCAFVGQTDCAGQTGLRSFLSGGRPVNTGQDVHAFFFETAMNMSENLDVQLAVRYESYGETDTFDPKLAGRYTVNDWLTLRGSVQTTFRGPDIDSLSPNAVTALSYVGPTAAFKAIDAVGNPDLEPEQAFTYNLGAVMNFTDNLTVTVDYWNYDFDNPIVLEDFNALVTAYSSGGAAKAAVQEQIFCTNAGNDGSCAASGLERIVVQSVNGPSIETSGVDVFVNYILDSSVGQFTFGADVSHTLQYEQDEYVKNGAVVQESYDAAGFLNAGRGARPLPDTKGRVFGEYTLENHNVLLYVNHTSEYEDERYANTTVDSQTTYDLHYRLNLFDDSTALTFSAINFTDEQAPLARVDLGYDAYTHNSFGAMYKVGIEYRMGQ
tara:strand:- start:6056 stop:8950 length:2895 start_codon:yes stop_codon:yes gene_type:complete